MRKGRLAGALGSWWCGHLSPLRGSLHCWGLPTVPPSAPPWATFWPPLWGLGSLASLGCVGLGEFRPTRMSALPAGRPASPLVVRRVLAWGWERPRMAAPVGAAPMGSHPWLCCLAVR